MYDELKRFDINPSCGAHFPKGWIPLVEDALDQLSKLEGWDPGCVVQIKEKFGTLRLYLDCFDSAHAEIVTAAENKSASICQDCGSPGSISRAGYWMRTLCSLCEVNYARS